MYECSIAPKVPDPKTATEIDVFEAYSETYLAWDDCYKKLFSLKSYAFANSKNGNSK